MSAEYPSTTTQLSLLMQLRDPTDEAARRRFVRKYGRIIYNWCCRCGLRHEDAEDATQEVLIKLIQKLAVLRYDPALGRFRPWLYTITKNTVRDALRKRSNSPGASVDVTDERHADSVHASDGLVGDVVEKLLGDEVLSRLQAQAQPWHYTAFLLWTGLAGAGEGESVPERPQDLEIAEIAAQLGKEISATRVAIFRLKRLWEQIYRELDPDSQE